MKNLGIVSFSLLTRINLQSCQANTNQLKSSEHDMEFDQLAESSDVCGDLCFVQTIKDLVQFFIGK